MVYHLLTIAQKSEDRMECRMPRSFHRSSMEHHRINGALRRAFALMRKDLLERFEGSGASL
ncbi:hypothetical protein CR513_37531, partial [Mucuna pruriens]